MSSVVNGKIDNIDNSSTSSIGDEGELNNDIFQNNNFKVLTETSLTDEYATEPIDGKLFPNFNEAEEFIYQYALEHGFNLRKDNLKKRKGTDEIKWRKYRCSKFTSKPFKPKDGAAPCPSCPVYIGVKVNSDGSAVISRSQLVHSHSTNYSNLKKDNYTNFMVLCKRVGKLVSNNEEQFQKVYDILADFEKSLKSDESYENNFVLKANSNNSLIGEIEDNSNSYPNKLAKIIDSGASQPNGEENILQNILYEDVPIKDTIEFKSSKSVKLRGRPMKKND